MLINRSHMYNIFIFLILYLSCSFSFAKSLAVDYDILYVRYPATNPKGLFVSIPQGEKPYDIAAGSDLILLHPDGTEDIVVDCSKCSVMDPFISYDGKWAYYSLIEEAKKSSASWIYKVNLTKKPYKKIRLTFDDGFNDRLYKTNTLSESKLINHRKIRDMAPVPLADGRLLFTSNRAGLVALNPGTDAVIKGSIQELYIMDDHNGEATTAALANTKKLENSNLHMVQHPIQLKDGRILFSSWHDVGHKFRYAMTSLFTINPDGTNIKQFTEPHERHKRLDHFITQLADEKIISTLYYPSFDYGFGILMRSPLIISEPVFLRNSIKQKFVFGKNNKVSFREFDRKNTLTITPHTTSADRPAPNLSGKYSMPSAAPYDGLLTAYSKGSVNYFNAECAKKKLCEALKSGIYLIPNVSSNIINTPSQLIKIKDDPNYNEIWPRAVVPFKAIYGQDKPDILPPIINKSSEAVAIIGTSSMYNRESNGSDDPFQSSSSRELHDGNWTIQGAESGVFSNDDIYGVRIISTPAKPFTKPINKYKNKKRWENIKPYLIDKRLDKVVARYGSFHGEKWEILGEFPLMHKQNGLKDKQGNPDTSWQAKIPAETPFLIQTIDKNGMTLVSELTWRALKSGENRTDCGGCHAHSIPALDFKTTATGKGYPIYDVPGVDDFDSRIDDGTWDLTSGSIPVLAENKVVFHHSGVLDVEFRRDVFPILKQQCMSCHQTKNERSSFVITADSADKTYQNLTYNKRKNGKKFIVPQISRFIRSPQARQSLLVWVAWNKRLDGRKNSTRDNDIDFPFQHPFMDLSDKEKRTIARWADLGGPIDFPQTDGFGYTDDSQLPIINIAYPLIGKNKINDNLVIAFHDVKSGIDWTSLKLQYYTVEQSMDISKSNGWFNSSKPLIKKDVYINQKKRINDKGVLRLPLSDLHIELDKEYILEVTIKDKVGNRNIATSRFSINN